MTKGGKMGRKGSVATIILVILILLSMALAGGTFYLLQKERVENQKLQVQMEELKVNIEKTKTDLLSSRKEISGLEMRLKNAQSQIEVLTSDLQQEKVSKQDTMKQMDRLMVELEQQKLARTDLEKKFTQAQEDSKRTQAKLKDLEARKAELELKVSELETKSQDLQTKVNEIELGKIVVSPEQQVAPHPTQKAVKQSKKQVKAQPPDRASATEGKVLVVNRDYSFAVINMGSKDGVNVGSVFSVSHNNKYLGDIKIEKVHDAMAAGGFLNPEMKDKVAEGDKVTKKTK